MKFRITKIEKKQEKNDIVGVLLIAERMLDSASFHRKEVSTFFFMLKEKYAELINSHRDDIYVDLEECIVETNPYCLKNESGILIDEEGSPFLTNMPIYLLKGRNQAFDSCVIIKSNIFYEQSRRIELGEIVSCEEFVFLQIKYKSEEFCLRDRDLSLFDDFDDSFTYNWWFHNDYNIIESTQFNAYKPIVFNINSRLRKNIEDFSNTDWREIDVKVNSWLPLAKAIGAVLCGAKVSIKYFKPITEYYRMGNDYLIHVGPCINRMSFNRILTLLKNIPGSFRIFLKKEDLNDRKIVIGSYYPSAKGRKVERYPIYDDYGLTISEFLKIPLDIQRSDLIATYNNYSEQREIDRSYCEDIMPLSEIVDSCFFGHNFYFINEGEYSVTVEFEALHFYLYVEEKIKSNKILQYKTERSYTEFPRGNAYVEVTFRFRDSSIRYTREMYDAVTKC